MPTLAELLALPRESLVYILDATPVDSLGADVPIGYSRGRVTRPLFGETTRQFAPRLVRALSISTQTNPLGLGERNDSSVGVIEVAWQDGLDDDLAALAFDGRPITIRLGRNGDALASCPVLYTGRGEATYWTESRFSIVLRDPQIAFDKPIQSAFYLGDGSTYEGGADLEGFPKPIALGQPRNVTPVKVDGTTANLIYQFHDGRAKAVDAVYVNGVAWINDGDTANLPAWTPIAGRFKTDLDRGMFRLGSQPNGLVTADVQGDNACPDVTFPQRAADLVRRIAKQRAGLTAGEIDATALATLNSNAPYALSFYTGTQNPTIAEVLDEILGSVGGFRYFTAAGVLVMGQLRFRPATFSISRAAAQIAADGLRVPRQAPPAYSVKLGYGRMWTVMQPNDFAGVVSDAFRAERSTEFRYRSSSDSSVSDRYATAREIVEPTLIDSSTHADLEAYRRLLLLKSARVVEIDARRVPYQITPGQTITVTHPRFGFDAGVSVAALGVSEDADSCATVVRGIYAAP